MVHHPEATASTSGAQDNALAVAGQLTLVVLFIGCSWIKIFDDVATLSDARLASRVLGFASTSILATMLIILIFGVLVIAVVSAVWSTQREARVPTLRLRRTRAPPELTMEPGQVYHTFLSHVWLTAQDQAATLKRQLQRMLPGIRAFLE